MLVDFELSLLDAGYPYANVAYKISRALIDTAEQQKDDCRARLVMLSRHYHWVSCHHYEGPRSDYVFLSASLEASTASKSEMENHQDTAKTKLSAATDPLIGTVREDSAPLLMIAGKASAVEMQVEPAPWSKVDLQILTVESLTQDSFSQLSAGKILALRVPHYYDGSSAHRLGRWIHRYTARKMMQQMLASPRQRNENAKEVYRESCRYTRVLGTTRYSLAAKRWEKSLYLNALECAAADNAALREFAGEQDPALRLLNSLHEAYPHGARFLAPEGREMIYGAGGTVYPPISLTSPHVDLAFLDEQTQFSAIIYLILPKEGGELKIWPDKEVYFLTRNEQQTWPATLFRPFPGDLILFDTSRVHAVTSFTRGFRVSSRMLIGFEPGKPLELYN